MVGSAFFYNFMEFLTNLNIAGWSSGQLVSLIIWRSKVRVLPTATKTSTDHYYEWGILRYIDPYLNIMKPAKTRVVANNVLIFVRNHMMERNRLYNRASPYLVNLLVLLASSAFILFYLIHFVSTIFYN